jgi:adenylate cyclase
MNQYGVLMHGVCLATDAGQYTTLSESISPLELHKLMNDYYAAIFPGVKSRNGLISDVIGDAMLAVWATKKIDNKLRLNACCAALEIKSAVDEFNESSPHYLATRMGLHYGEMRLGNVGAKEHFEYRAVGDTVNTSTRIEGLNKLLGTGILASAPVIDGLSEFITREVGTFLLKGKINPVTLFELMGLKTKVDQTDNVNCLQLNTLFANALAAFKVHELSEALAKFKAIHKLYPDDGPTRFYIHYLQKQLSSKSKKGSKEHATFIDVGNITSRLH